MVRDDDAVAKQHPTQLHNPLFRFNCIKTILKHHTHTHTTQVLPSTLGLVSRGCFFFCTVLSVAHYCCFIFNEVLLMPFCTNLVLLWLKWQRSGVVPEGYDAGIHQRWQKWASLNTNRQRPGGFLLDG